jgi:3-oxoacyl-[acyl-carrier-protein] synthase III
MGSLCLKTQYSVLRSNMEALNANNLQVSDIDMLIPHQANLRISQFIQQKFKLTDDQVFNNIMKYGNTTAASVPMHLPKLGNKAKSRKAIPWCSQHLVAALPGAVLL